MFTKTHPKDSNRIKLGEHFQPECNPTLVHANSSLLLQDTFKWIQVTTGSRSLMSAAVLH